MVICKNRQIKYVLSRNSGGERIQFIAINDNTYCPTRVKDNYKMARRKRSFHLMTGILLGVLTGYLLRVYPWNATDPATLDNSSVSCSQYGRRISTINKLNEPPEVDPFKIIGLTEERTVHNSKTNLLFVGVMTAEKYLKTRAHAVYKTWGKELPGRLAFFSSEVSRSKVLPLVSLKGVDDSYPPQKKSFMMLLYMHDNFIDKFEWFLRADDDVFIRADKLEVLLRSVDSRRAQFIGQAGRGNTEEFGSLSLEYDENFCMGGPGVILSRETLKRIAPHIKECLKNLYTTHEDVELGRCVKKYAGVPCTWSYEMQSILYHNSSGNLAFTGKLKKREVHQAITMHPVKEHRHMYRIHSYLKNLKIQDLKVSAIALHRDIFIAARELRLDPASLPPFQLADGVPLYLYPQGHSQYLGDTNILGVTPNLNRYRPTELKNVIWWDFISKAIFSPSNANPKRRMEFSMREGLDDIIRELMENINAFSKQRGRIIEFREILYGYQRLDPIHGVDYILDILLVYKKYRGRKMTVPVRRHAYLQQSFTGIEIREVPLGEPPLTKSAEQEDKKDEDYGTDDLYPSGQFAVSTQATPFLNFKKLNVPIREAFETGINKLSENLPYVFRSLQSGDNSIKRINFILPLSGRFDTFVRFMKNYEEVCLFKDKKTSLFIPLYQDGNAPADFNRTVALISLFQNKYPASKIQLIKILNSQFSRAVALEKGVEVCDSGDLLFFIDVDILFTSESLQRIRLNTIKNYQVYFPIVFSQYDPLVVSGEDFNVIKTVNKVVVNNFDSEQTNIASQSFVDRELRTDDHGYFRQFGFGIACVYKDDFNSVGGFNTDIKGWGLEDVNLYDKFVQSNLSIFRTVDMDLVHMFHSVGCDKNLDLAQYNMCLGTKGNTFGSIKHMTLYLFNHPIVLPVAPQSPVYDEPNKVPSKR